MHDHSLDHEDQEVGEDVVSELVHQDKGLRVVDDQSQQDGGENADDVELHDSRAAQDGQEDTGVQNGILLLKRRPGTRRQIPCRWFLLPKGSTQSFGDCKGKPLVLYQHGHQTSQADSSSQHVPNERSGVQIKQDRVDEVIDLHHH